MQISVVASPHMAAEPHGAAHSHLPAGQGRASEGQTGENPWVVTITVHQAKQKLHTTAKQKAAHKSKAKHRIRSPFPMVKQVFSHLQDSQANTCIRVN